MPLPNPHGNASGEIAHNSVYDTGQTPGSTGGKFIGFGEEGTSAVGNRAHWALSENIDYVYQILSEDMALPAGASFTAVDQGGGGQLKYQITDDVFVGDATYPGSAGSSDPEGMLMLFAVLDDQYNELTDGSGNEVRVKLVRDSTEVDDMYQGGSPFVSYFPTNPYVYFHTVNPTTGAEVDASYDIPTGTDVRLLYASKGNMENLPRDAFSRFKVQSATEVEAGAFLQDGSKKMTGHADWDGHRIDNVLEVRGVSGSDLVLRGILDDVWMLADSGDVIFRDQNTSPAGVKFSQTGQGAPYLPIGAAYNNSVLGALNSQIAGSEILRGNRPLNRTGVFTSNVAGPSLDYPALDLMASGEVIQIPAGNVDLSFVGVGTVYVYYNPGADAVQGLQTFFPSSFPAGGILLWKGYWNGAAWSSEVDLRWPSHRNGTYEAWYVGDGIGTDFTDMDTLEAVINNGWNQVPMEDTHKMREIVVAGEAQASSTFTLNPNWRLRGASFRPSGTAYENEIVTSTTFSTSSSVISTGANCEVRDLKIRWNNTSAHQVATNAAVTLGAGGVAKNLYFGDGTYSFYACLHLGDRALVESCVLTFAAYRGYGIITGSGCHITNTDLPTFGAGAGPAVAYVRFSGTDNVIDNCRFDGGSWPASRFVECGYANNTIQNCQGDMSGVGAQPVVQLLDGTEVGITLTNNRFLNGYRLISSALNNGSLVMRVRAYHNIIEDFASTIFDFNNTSVHPESVVHIVDNVLDGLVAGYNIYAYVVPEIKIARNQITDNGGAGIRIRDGSRAVIEGNYIEGYGTGNAIQLDSATGSQMVHNNWVGDVGAPASSIQFLLESPRSMVTSNYFEGGANCEDAIRVRVNDCTISGNLFRQHARRYIHVDSTLGGGDGTAIHGNEFWSGIDKAGTVGAVTWVVAEAAVYLETGISILNNISIKNNMFNGQTGRCIVTGPRIGTPGVTGLNIVANNFHYVSGAYLFDSGGAQMTEEGVVRVEYGGGAGTGNIINSNTFVSCGHGTWFAGTTKVSYMIYSSANQAVISGNNIYDMIGGHNSAYNLEASVGIQVYDGAIVTNNMIFKSFNSDAPYSYDGIAVHGSGHGIVSNNFIYSDGTPPAGMGMYRGYIFGGAVLVNCMGNMHRGTVVNYAGGIYAYNTSRSSATSGIEVGNYAETGPCSMGGTNILVMGNINDNLGMVHAVTGVPTAYTASPVNDWNFKI